jgi:hypothetical protein
VRDEVGDDSGDLVGQHDLVAILTPEQNGQRELKLFIFVIYLILPVFQ